MPEPQEYSKLNELLELTKENNRILRSMHRRMLWSQVFTFIYWLIILGAMGWSFYYLQPYLNQYWGAFQTLSQKMSDIENGGVMLPSDLRDALEKVR